METSLLEAYLRGTILEQITKYPVTADSVPKALGGGALWEETPEEVLLVLFLDPGGSRWTEQRSRKPLETLLSEQQQFSATAHRLLSGDFQVRPFTLDGTPCCLLGRRAGEEPASPEALFGRMRELQTLLHRELGVRYTVYLSEPAAYPEALPAAYQTLRYLIQYDEIMQTEKHILTPKDISWRETDASRIIAAEHKYQNCINARDFEKASRLALELLSMETCASATNCINLKDRVIARADAALDALNIPFDGRSAGDFPAWVAFEQLLHARTLHDFQRLLPLFFHALQAYTCESLRDRNNQVMDFIRSNYDDPGLCAGMICAEFGISYSHLAKTLSESTGAGLIDYVHSLRLQEAKHLLENSDAKIDVIAREVGYLSARTLNRAFIRYEEITPREYRKLHRAENGPAENRPIEKNGPNSSH